MYGCHICDILEVRSVCEYFLELCLVDDFLAGCIHEAATPRHARHKIVVD